MKTSSELINESRILNEFVKLTSFDAESFHEAQIARYLEDRLKALGLDVITDDAKSRLKDACPDSSPASNIYGYLKGDASGEPLLFCSHMDTVSPGNGKCAVIHPDGTITSDKTTVLGADDVSGLTAILEALSVIKESKLPHPDLEVLFTAAEEPYCEGSRYVRYENLKSKTAYVLDLTGSVGYAALAAPSIISFSANIRGKAAHAGFEPEKGINALTSAGRAICRIQTGHVTSDTTVNIGVIRGGSGRNIVPENVHLEGEIRSLNHEDAMYRANEVKKVFEEEAKKLGCSVCVRINQHIKAYRVCENSTAVMRFKRGALISERCHKPVTQITLGGSDANRLNENGIETIVLACGMENCHSTEEYTSIDKLCAAAELTLNIMRSDYHEKE